jgi:rhodanese-related sulfurtransferase
MVEIISRDELRKKIADKDSFKLLDVRDTPDYEKEHIVTAAHLLISDMNKDRISEMFEEDDLIITYSKDFDCPASRIAAEKLQEFGYKNVLRYRGGWKEWKDSQFPTE